MEEMSVDIHPKYSCLRASVNVVISSCQSNIKLILFSQPVVLIVRVLDQLAILSLVIFILTFHHSFLHELTLKVSSAGLQLTMGLIVDVCR